MTDHAQAKIELIGAAINAAEQMNVKAGKPLDAHELAAFSLLRIAARQYKETKQPKRIDEADGEFDDLHGCG
jgi:hypothetical protein